MLRKASCLLFISTIMCKHYTYTFFNGVQCMQLKPCTSRSIKGSEKMYKCSKTHANRYSNINLDLIFRTSKNKTDYKYKCYHTNDLVHRNNIFLMYNCCQILC